MWKDKYKIGVETIDEQHQELFRRVEDFIKTFRGEGSWDDRLEKVKETLDFMSAYVVTHFDDEEAYQKTISYPKYEEHLQLHGRFKAEVGKYVDKFNSEGFDEELVQEFGGKLMTWLIYHVAGADQEIGKYAESLGGGNNES